MKDKEAGSDYLVRTLNTLFNPFEFENILSPPQATPWSRALHHAGGLALGYGGLAIVLRKMMQYKSELDREKDDEKLRSYAAAKYPTLSPDPKKDPEEERKLEAPGVAPVTSMPELEDKVAFTSGATKGLRPAERLVKKTVWGPQDPAHLALAAAAAVIGGSAGWKLADYLEDKRRGKELENRVDVAADEIDRLLYEEMMKREQKTASVRLSPTNISRNPYKGIPSATPGGPDEPSMVASLLHPGRALKGAETLWWLWAVAAFALTYKAAKIYGDAKDPNRRRIKQLQEVAKERAKSKEAPVLMQVGDLPSPPKTRSISTETVQAAAPEPVLPPLPKPSVPKVSAPKPRSLAADMGKAVEVDKDDPYAHLLTT